MSESAPRGALVDMLSLRSLLVAAQGELRSGSLEKADLLISEVLAVLSVPLSGAVPDPPAAHAAVGAAIKAAHETLVSGGLTNPAEILIVQTHDENGRTIGRTAASTIANPQDLLRRMLQSMEGAV